jgi:raffinose/stachyose/melibiose transport system permease protein
MPGRAWSIVWSTARWVVLLVVGAVIVVPLAYTVLGGFRTTGQLAARPVALPDPWVPTNYTEILTSDTFWQQLGQSAVIAGISTFVVVSAAAMAAYVFARFTFPGRELMYGLFTLGLLFPIAVAILPLYLTIRQLGLVGSPLGVALPQAAFGIPITVLILRPFFQSIPRELEDAAAIDGCGRFGFFWRILLPLSRPALSTVAVLAVVTSWNAFLLPLIVLTGSNDWTLPLGLTNYSTQYSADTARVLAFTALSMVPALGFYLLAERQLVGGLAGAVKG